jgi:predicted anti-sigma-YlaC factor YlaD
MRADSDRQTAWLSSRETATDVRLAVLLALDGPAGNTRAGSAPRAPGKAGGTSRKPVPGMARPAAPASRRPGPVLILLLCLGGAFVQGCSVKRIAVNRLGDALAGQGQTFASDDDPELVRAAVPFGLKLMEGLLAENPRHKGLLLAASRGFTQYAYAFVQQDGEELEDLDFRASSEARARARRLYLRARDYGLRGLEVEHPGFAETFHRSPEEALLRTAKTDVPLLYWAAVSWAGVISLSKDDPDRVAELYLMEALIDRALELDEGFDNGAIHVFLITYEAARPGGQDPAATARRHFDRAVELTGGRQAAPYVSLAEAVCVNARDRAGFQALLEKAAAVDPGADPATSLQNRIYQRRARWLLARADQFFLQP